jgi:hypothetical protein
MLKFKNQDVSDAPTVLLLSTVFAECGTGKDMGVADDAESGELTIEDACAIANLRIDEMREQLHRLIEAAVGGGMPVDVPAYVEGEHGGDWSKAVAFACEAIAVHQNRIPRPMEQRGTTLSDPDRRGN